MSGLCALSLPRQGSLPCISLSVLTAILICVCPSTDASIVQANTELVLETLSQMDDLEEFLSKDKHADPDFTKKLWAYLTINQLLAER